MFLNRSRSKNRTPKIFWGSRRYWRKRLLHPVETQGAVREPGQGVVQGVVHELGLGELAGGHVGQRAGDPVPLVARISDRESTRQHPQDVAGLSVQPVLALEVRCMPLQVVVERSA